MFNYFDLSIIPTFLSRFKVEKILAIGLSNELILDEIISYCNKSTTLYAIDPKINIKDLIKEDESLNNIKDYINYFSDDSLNVLPTLSNLDAIFINDDPNWYTIYNELNIIKENHINFPIVFVCNNKYPHKRRDSYINPEKIPEEFKNECCNELLILYEENNETKETRVTDGLCHAIHQDTPRNGVLTAMEDFIKENPSLKMLEINPIEGISLIYQSSDIVDLRIKRILEEQVNHEYDINELSDKFIENNILLNHVSKINLLKDDIERIEEFKSEIKDKDYQIKEYEDEIDFQNTQIKYQDSKINNIQSQIALNETKFQGFEAKLLNKDNEIREKEIELSSKEDEIKIKEEEINSINLKLSMKEDELKTTQNRLNNLETSFLDIKKELDATRKQLSQGQTGFISSSYVGTDYDKESENQYLIKQHIKQLSKSEREKYCIRCFKEEINNNKAEITYLKNSSLTKKILSPLSYPYLLINSKPKELFTNLKLYKALKKSECFDIGYYVNKYPDMAKSKWYKYFSPELHYVCKGFDEKREFNKKYFNTNDKKTLLEDIKSK